MTGDLVCEEVSHFNLAFAASGCPLARSCYPLRADAGSRGAAGAERSELALDAAEVARHAGNLVVDRCG